MKYILFSALIGCSIPLLSFCTDINQAEVVYLENSLSEPSFSGGNDIRPAFEYRGYSPSTCYSVSANHSLWYLEETRSVGDAGDAITPISGFLVNGDTGQLVPAGRLELPNLLFEQRAGQTTNVILYFLDDGRGDYLLVGNYVFTASSRTGPVPEIPNAGGLRLIDVSNPYAPRTLVHIPSLEAISAAFIDEHFLSVNLVVQEEFFTNYYWILYDIHNPELPAEVLRLETGNRLIYSAAFHPNDPSILYIGLDGVLVCKKENNEWQALIHWKWDDQPYNVFSLQVFQDYLFLVTQKNVNPLLEALPGYEQRVVSLHSPTEAGEVNTLPLLFRNSQQRIHLGTFNQENRFLSVLHEGSFLTQINSEKRLEPMAYYSSLAGDCMPPHRMDRWLILGKSPIRFYILSSIFQLNTAVNTWYRE